MTRNDQIASLLCRAVPLVLSRGLHDPRVQGMISVTHVDVSPDLAHATVNVSILPADKADLTMHGLRHAAGHIRSQVGREVDLRRMPRLEFKYDDSLKRQAAVFSALQQDPAPSSAGAEPRIDKDCST